eukprot:1603920-Rhodomonas_salina.1
MGPSTILNLRGRAEEDISNTNSITTIVQFSYLPRVPGGAASGRCLRGKNTTAERSEAWNC